MIPRNDIRQSMLLPGVLLLTLYFLIGQTVPAPAQEPAGCPQAISSYWRFDEPDGNVFSDVTGMNPASCAVARCPGTTAGRLNNALLFNGIDNEVTVPPSAQFDWGPSDSFSIEFWVKTDSASTCAGNQVVVGRDDSTSQLHWWAGCWNGGEAGFYLIDKAGNAAGLSGTTDLTDGLWHHVAAVRDAAVDEIRLYVDGKKEDSFFQAYPAGFDSSTASLNIGWLNILSLYHFAGAADELAFHGRALSEQEIRQHYFDGTIGLHRGYCGCVSPARVMPLGDSITYGTYGNGEMRPPELITGYRQPLYLSLTNSGYFVDFVGGLQDGENALPAFDYDHQGVPGIRDYEVAANVYGYLLQNPADVILLHIGTNALDTSPADVENILEEIDRFSPDSTVVLARIINRIAYSLPTTQFNDNVEAMALGRIAAGDRILIVDQESALNYAADMWDNLHPNDTGYQKMANVWREALGDLLPVCGQIPPEITSSPVTTAYKGLHYSYNVDAAGNPAPQYSLHAFPQGMTINPETGLIRWQPAGTGLFAVTAAADNAMGTDTQSFTVEVIEAPFCSAGLRHYWKLEENVPPYSDFYGGSSASCVRCPAAVSGVVGTGQEFDADTLLNVPDDNSFDWGQGDSFSVEFWMKTESASTCSGNQVIVGRDDSATKLHWWVGCQNGGKAVFYLIDKGGAGTGVAGTTDITDGQWHHVVAVRDATANQNLIYVDGKKENAVTKTYTSGFDSAGASLNFGWLNLSTGYHFLGDVDEIALYHRALSDGEIAQHSINGESGKDYCSGMAGSISINGDALSTNSALVSLTLSCKVPSGVCTEMQLSNDNISYASPEPYAASRAWNLTTAGGDGIRAVYVQFKDSAGLWSLPYSDKIVLDTVPPNTTITGRPADFSNSPLASFVFTSEAGASFECQLDSGSFGACGSPWNYFGLSEGGHVFAVRAKDAAGNIDPTPASAQWTIDTMPPVDGSLSAVASGTTVNLQWTAGSDSGSGLAASGTYKLVASEGSVPPADCSGSALYLGAGLSYAHTGLTAGARYSYRVCAYDKAGNVSEGSVASATVSTSGKMARNSYFILPEQWLITAYTKTGSPYTVYLEVMDSAGSAVSASLIQGLSTNPMVVTDDAQRPGATLVFDHAARTAYVIHDSSGTPVISVLPDIRAVQAGSPVLQVSATVINFGTVAVGSSKGSTVTVSNTGNANLSVASVSAPAAPFSKTGDTCSGGTLAPGGACAVTITFSPAAATTSTGSFIITSNGGNAAVQLQGTGTAASQPPVKW